MASVPLRVYKVVVVSYRATSAGNFASSRWFLAFLSLVAPLVPCAAEGVCAVLLTDITAQAGIDHVHAVANENPDACMFAAIQAPPDAAFDVAGHECLPERFTAGIAAGDADGDGRDDLLFTRLNGSPVLYGNLGDGTFEDRTAPSGLGAWSFASSGATWVDIDRDGDLDLYVTSLVDTRNYLFVNDGAGTFTEDAVARGVDVDTGIVHAGFSTASGDFDGDGWPDLFTTEWRSPAFIPIGTPTHARLLRNRGAAAPGFFEDVTASAGIAIGSAENGASLSWAPAFVDLDGDGRQDLAVVADGGMSRLFWNEGGGVFTDGTVSAGVGTDENGMGSTFGDWDGDGDLDWFVSSI
jgi:hypothetical protein